MLLQTRYVTVTGLLEQWAGVIAAIRDLPRRRGRPAPDENPAADLASVEAELAEAGIIVPEFVHADEDVERIASELLATWRRLHGVEECEGCGLSKLCDVGRWCAQCEADEAAYEAAQQGAA